LNALAKMHEYTSAGPPPRQTGSAPMLPGFAAIFELDWEVSRVTAPAEILAEQLPLAWTVHLYYNICRPPARPAETNWRTA
jgi:hypothetical protein